ncbi:hypothetical protein TRVA0_002S03972 [Trichomonascus vanleenenianus]|uniref:uncharacterized protein n=1 Tax=Trichomonascus vanleenenianus TaxID=2268995 RepID=UPI003ECB09D7
MGAEKKTIKGKENKPPKNKAILDRKQGGISATPATKRSIYLSPQEEEDMVHLLKQLMRLTGLAVPSRIIGLIIATVIPPDKRRSNNTELIHGVFTGRHKKVWVPSPSWVHKFVAKHELYSDEEKDVMDFWGVGIQSARHGETILIPGVDPHPGRIIVRNPHIEKLTYEMVKAIADSREEEYKFIFFPRLLRFLMYKGDHYFKDEQKINNIISAYYDRHDGLPDPYSDSDDCNYEEYESEDDDSEDDNCDGDNYDEDNSDDDSSNDNHDTPKITPTGTFREWNTFLRQLCGD